MALDDDVEETKVPLKGGVAPHDPKVTSFLRIARNGEIGKLIELIVKDHDIINASNNVGDIRDEAHLAKLHICAFVTVFFFFFSTRRPLINIPPLSLSRPPRMALTLCI